MSIYRNGISIGAATNTGSTVDVLVTSGGTFTYKVCEYGTTTCSNTAPVTV